MVHKELMTKREIKAYEALEAEVKKMNGRHYVGELVMVQEDDGEFVVNEMFYFSFRNIDIIKYTHYKPIEKQILPLY